jgi:uncharacterized protein YifE (UPF0438 family)
MDVLYLVYSILDNEEGDIMSFGPIDLQVMMPKTNDVAQLNQNVLNRNEAAAQQLANSTQKNVSESTKQVVNTKKPENAQINLEEKNKNGYNGNKKKKKNNDTSDEEKNEKNNKDKTKSNYSFDVRI